MKTLFGLCLALSLVATLAGCDKKTTEEKKVDTMSTPEGSTTTTESKKIETTGENPPETK